MPADAPRAGAARAAAEHPALVQRARKAHVGGSCAQNVETVLELVQPLLLKATMAEEQGREQRLVFSLYLEAMVAGDEMAIWSLLHRLLLTPRPSLLLGGTACLFG